MLKPQKAAIYSKAEIIVLVCACVPVCPYPAGVLLLFGFIYRSFCAPRFLVGTFASTKLDFFWRCFAVHRKVVFCTTNATIFASCCCTDKTVKRQERGILKPSHFIRGLLANAPIRLKNQPTKAVRAMLLLYALCFALLRTLLQYCCLPVLFVLCLSLSRRGSSCAHA